MSEAQVGPGLAGAGRDLLDFDPRPEIDVDQALQQAVAYLEMTPEAVEAIIV